MNEIAPILQQLADQLGTTVEYLWPLLVKQVQIDWVARTTVCLFAFFVLSFLSWMISKIDNFFDEPETGIPFLILTVAAGVFGTVGLCMLSDISMLFVPEAHVINQILELVG